MGKSQLSLDKLLPKFRNIQVCCYEDVECCNNPTALHDKSNNLIYSCFGMGLWLLSDFPYSQIKYTW